MQALQTHLTPSEDYVRRYWKHLTQKKTVNNWNRYGLLSAMHNGLYRCLACREVWDSPDKARAHHCHYEKAFRYYIANHGKPPHIQPKRKRIVKEPKTLPDYTRPKLMNTESKNIQDSILALIRDTAMLQLRVRELENAVASMIKEENKWWKIW
ncbi:MAG: hypothetical protein GWN86_07040 [Desulfobacterales bacterium]|nr:hypothetical protein [Desulfobacterales bacterium]